MDAVTREQTWKGNRRVKDWIDTSSSFSKSESEDEEKCAALGSRGRREEQCTAPGPQGRRCLRRGGTALVIIFHFGCLPLVGFADASDTVTLLCWLVFELLRSDSSPFARNASLQLLVTWLCTLVYKLDSRFCNRNCMQFWTLHAVVDSVNAAHAWVALSSIYLRVALAEEIFGMPLWSNVVASMRQGYVALRLVWSAGALAFAGLSYFSGLCLWLPPWKVDKGTEDWYFMVVVCGGLVSWILAFVVSARSSSIILNSALVDESNSIRTYVDAEAAWARTVLYRIRWAEFWLCGVYMFGYALCMICSTLQLLGFRAAAAWAYSDSTLSSANTICSIIVLVSLLSMTNFYRPLQPHLHLPGGCKRVARPRLRRSVTRRWSDKVLDLAERSMEVQALLDFYDRLGPSGDAMPHFDPWLHTTNDVVRSAIIPLSRSGRGGGPYASLQESSSPGSLAECMVTHDWHNLFAHLVAAVVADALGMDEFGPIAMQLARRGTRPLRRRLHRKDPEALLRRYWICAFCVNQHASICGGFGREPPVDSPEYDRWHENRRDSVTQDLHSCCDCREPKVFNDSPDDCEINKFSDMMALLARESRDFRQVIAVDREFGLFSRIWCVAEIVQAHESGIPQRVCVLSNEALALDNEDLSLYVKLANLRVTECNASRPEDKEQILATIADTNEFDAHLQTLIFGEHGMMSQRLVGFDILHAATLSMRRVRLVTSSASQFSRTTSDSVSTTSSDDSDD